MNHDRILAGNALRDWDPAETKVLYWSGACKALITGTDLPGCKRSPIGNALPDSVIEHHPGGLRSLQSARRRWITENSRIADDYARKAGLLK